MELKLSARFVLLLLINLFLMYSETNAQFIKESWYTLLKNATDVLIIKVDRIEGGKYGEKAIAHVERSFKKTVLSDSIELPFVYEGWPVGEKGFTMVSETVPISFESGKRYAVLIQNWHKWLNPYAAEAKYEVIDYPDRTFFCITDDNDPQLLEMERLLKIINESNVDVRINSLLDMTRDDGTKIRIDAIEALIEFRTPKAERTFISLLRNDPDSLVRSSAAIGLKYFRDNEVVGSLIECLSKEKSDNVKYDIIRTLGMIRTKIANPFLLGIYEKESYNIRNAILGTVSVSADSTVVPPLIHLFKYDPDRQHRHQMAQTISSFHTFEADEFSSRLLDTVESYWLKTAVMEGWTETGYTKGYDEIARWASVPCTAAKQRPKRVSDVQGLMFPLLTAVKKLGTPEQIASTLKIYADCSDPVIRQRAIEILKAQLKKNITSELHERIEAVIKTFPPN
jgi:hypothetical protein